jgi:hypothetical protein
VSIPVWAMPDCAISHSYGNFRVTFVLTYAINSLIEPGRRPGLRVPYTKGRFPALHASNDRNENYKFGWLRTSQKLPKGKGIWLRGPETSRKRHSLILPYRLNWSATWQRRSRSITANGDPSTHLSGKCVTQELRCLHNSPSHGRTSERRRHYLFLTDADATGLLRRDSCFRSPRGYHLAGDRE